MTFTGLASVVDPATLPPPPAFDPGEDVGEVRAQTDDHRRRWAEAMRPEDEIVESWVEEVEPLGFRLRSWGSAARQAGDPLQHVVSFAFASEAEPALKRKLVELASRLGVEIAEVRNLEHELIWEDVSGPPHG